MKDERSAPALVGDLIAHVGDLFRKELQLFRAEMNEKSSQAMVALGSIAAGLVVAIVALNVLAAALVVAIEAAGIPGGWAALIVGGVLAIIAFALARGGLAGLKGTNLAPGRTTQSVQRDAEMAKEHLG
jgi:Putative Actinobacterial Holin-X, holin superfamily III